MELKLISSASVPRALELGERMRLLNEPDVAASICRDILVASPGNQDAVRMLLLALTDQFGRRKGGPTLPDTEKVAEMLTSPYDQAYFRGVAYERWGRCKLQEGSPGYIAGDWLQRAMTYYAEAEKIRPPADDSAILRWNTCVRLMERVPELRGESLAHELHMGD